MYTIKVRYITGDSFGSEEVEDFVGSFSTIQEAQTACAYILDHNKLFNAWGQWNYPKAQKELDIEAVKNMPWFVECHYDNSKPSEHSVKFGDQVLHAFWMGYFETLLSLEIVLDSEQEENPMKFYV